VASFTTFRQETTKEGEGKASRVPVMDADAEWRKWTQAKSLEMRRCNVSATAFVTLNRPGKTSDSEHESC